jgi:hypothetical protein
MYCESNNVHLGKNQPFVGFEPTIFSLQVKRLATGPKRQCSHLLESNKQPKDDSDVKTTVFRSTIELRRELLTRSPRGRQTPRDLSVSKQVLLRMNHKVDILVYSVP